jgi:hypothetical protein
MDRLCGQGKAVNARLNAPRGFICIQSWERAANAQSMGVLQEPIAMGAAHILMQCVRLVWMKGILVECNGRISAGLFATRVIL